MTWPVLKDRLVVGLGLAALLAWAVFGWSPPLMLFALLLVCGIALWEFYDILAAGGMPHSRWVGLATGLAMVAATWHALRTVGGGGGEWIALFGVVAVILMRQLPGTNVPGALAAMAGTMLGVMYVAFLFNFFTRLLLTWGIDSGRWLVFYVLVVVKFADTGAYFVGCAWGRHKVVPRISPAKSWEGVWGGAATGWVVSQIVFWATGGRWGLISLRWYDATVLAVVLVLAGLAGDLVESVIKRSAGVKDSGHVAGMGGLLDMMDSLLFAAPAFYAYLRLFVWVGG